jgi:phosphate transport system substrate-binding protein
MGKQFGWALLSLSLFWAQAAITEERLVLTGSSTVAPLVLEIGKRFENQSPGVRIDVQTGGSSRGINDVRLGLADVGMASRDLTGAESDLAAHTIARDGIALIVHQSNPLDSLTRDQVLSIFRGEINNWRKLGGQDRRITVVNKAEGRSTLELFLEHFDVKNSQIRAQVVIGDNQQGIKTVAGQPGAIGYVSIGTAEYEQQQGTAIKLLPMAGVPAEVTAVEEGRYPLARPLNLVTRGELSPLARQFIDFARSPAVKDLVEAQFFVAPQR